MPTKPFSTLRDVVRAAKRLPLTKRGRPSGETERRRCNKRGRRGIGRRVWKVPTRLDDVRQHDHGEALLVLQLGERLLIEGRPSEGLDDGHQPVEQEERDRDSHHQLDQRKAALWRCAAPRADAGQGAHGSTYSV